MVEIVTPKEEPQIFKIKLSDASHLSMPIYSRGNNKEYLVHIVAVLRVIKQKGLPKKCQVLAKAVVKPSEALKNLQEAAGFQDTILTSIDVMARADPTDAPRSPKGSQQGNCRVVQATEEPAVQQRTVLMGLHLPQDARA